MSSFAAPLFFFVLDIILYYKVDCNIKGFRISCFYVSCYLMTAFLTRKFNCNTIFYNSFCRQQTCKYLEQQTFALFASPIYYFFPVMSPIITSNIKIEQIKLCRRMGQTNAVRQLFTPSMKAKTFSFQHVLTDLTTIGVNKLS